MTVKVVRTLNPNKLSLSDYLSISLGINFQFQHEMQNIKKLLKYNNYKP